MWIYQLASQYDFIVQVINSFCHWLFALWSEMQNGLLKFNHMFHTGIHFWLFFKNSFYLRCTLMFGKWKFPPVLFYAPEQQLLTSY